jgi:ABC-type sugar transport system ATPase subunit
MVNQPQESPSGASSSGIALCGLVKSFGDVQAVRGVDIVIGRGETVALLG